MTVGAEEGQAGAAPGLTPAQALRAIKQKTAAKNPGRIVIPKNSTPVNAGKERNHPKKENP